MDDLKIIADEVVAVAAGLSVAHFIVGDGIWSTHQAGTHTRASSITTYLSTAIPNLSGPCGVRGEAEPHLRRLTRTIDGVSSAVPP